MLMLTSARLQDIFNNPFESSSGFCADVFSSYIAANVFTVVCALAIVAVNYSLPRVVSFITNWERHATREAKDRSVAMKIFAAMFLNTAILVLISNAAWPKQVEAVTVDGTAVFSGNHTSFDPRWYTSAGASLVLTMIINIVSPHSKVFFEACRVRCCTQPRADKIATQRQLDEKYSPMEYVLPARIAGTLATASVCFFYSCGMPVLLFVGFVSLSVGFTIDKFVLLRLAKRPPRYNAGLSRFFVDMLSILVIFHLLVSLWMLSDEDIFYSPQLELLGIGAKVAR